MRFIWQKNRKLWTLERLKNKMKKSVFFSKKERFHLLKLHLHQIGKAQNVPVVASRLLFFCSNVRVLFFLLSVLLFEVPSLNFAFLGHIQPKIRATVWYAYGIIRQNWNSFYHRRNTKKTNYSADNLRVMGEIRKRKKKLRLLNWIFSFGKFFSTEIKNFPL